MCDKMTNNNPLIPDVPFHPGPVYRPPPKPIKQDMSYPQSSQSSTSIVDINPNINFDFEENSQSYYSEFHFRKALCPKHFRDQTSHFFKNQKN